MTQPMPSTDGASEPGRWVVVDTRNKTIVGGPYLWNGVDQWEPPETGHLMREADAHTAGYQQPT